MEGDTDSPTNFQAAPENRSRFFVGGKEASTTTRGSGGWHKPPATILERISRVQEVGTFKATGVRQNWDRERRRTVGPSEIVMKDEAVSGLIPGGRRELKFPGIRSDLFPGEDKVTVAEGALVDSGVAGLIEEAAGIDNSPVGVAKVQEDGRIPKIALGGRPVGIFHHSASEKSPGGEGLSEGEIIALRFTSGEVVEREGSEPVAQIAGAP